MVLANPLQGRLGGNPETRRVGLQGGYPREVTDTQTVPMDEELVSIAAELAVITRLVEQDDFGATLDRFVTRITRAIPGCDQAILTLRSEGTVETLSGGGELDFDPIAPGPVVEAVTFGEPRRLDDVAADQRWPSFSAQVANAGYRSCVALPLSTRGEDTAVLTLFSRKADQFVDTAYDLVLLLSLQAGTLVDNAVIYRDSQQLVTHLRTALHTRSLVGRAQGMLMRHHGCDSDQAFAALTRASQNTNTKLRDLAAQLVSAHERGEFESVLARVGLSTTGAA